MSTYRVWFVECDAAGMCGETFDDGTGPKSRGELLNEAFKRGWRQHGNKNFCPEHAEEAQ